MVGKTRSTRTSAGEQVGCIIIQVTWSANVKIFIKLRDRSSCGTGPKMRVPRGSPCLLTMTTAFLSNLISLPSPRALCNAARTITQLTTSPFFTFPRGTASFTEAMMRSPSLPCFPPPNTFMHQKLHKSAPNVINSSAQHVPRDKEHDGIILETKLQMSKKMCLKRCTLMHMTRLAPELSATSKLVRICTKERHWWLKKDVVADRSMRGRCAHDAMIAMNDEGLREASNPNLPSFSSVLEP